MFPCALLVYIGVIDLEFPFSIPRFPHQSKEGWSEADRATIFANHWDH